MADEKKFKFVSPGIFTNEIDRSQVEQIPTSIGPLVMGRSPKGPSMVPVTVNSLGQFISIFGDAESGLSQPADAWREGNHSAPLYGTYAATAYLRVGQTPLTFVRLAGVANSAASSTSEKAKAGWGISGFNTSAPTTGIATANALGLFVFGYNSSNTSNITGTLGAVFYTSGTAIFPTGTVGEGMNKLVLGLQSGVSKEFGLVLSGSYNNASTDKIVVSLERNSDKFIRSISKINKNPMASFASMGDVSTVEPSENIKGYWLGETYEATVQKLVYDNTTYNRYAYAVIPLSTANASKASHYSDYRDAQSPWVISQFIDGYDAFSFSGAKKLFKFITLNGTGDSYGHEIKISIDNIRYSVNENVDYGTFDVVIRSARDTDNRQVVLERYSNLNLNPLSSDYIATRIGDQYLSYDELTSQVRVNGERQNISKYVRVVVAEDVSNGATSPALLPFGFYGVPKLKNISSLSSSQTSVTAGNLLSANGLLSVGGLILTASIASVTASIRMPSFPMVASSSENGGSYNTTYFGINTLRSSTSTAYNEGYIDYSRFMGSDIVPASDWTDNFGFGSSVAASSFYEYADGFSLDEISASVQTNYSFTSSPSLRVLDLYYVSGSAVGGTSFNALSAGGTSPALPSAASYKNILKAGIRGFTMPMFGGFDGFAVYQREPLRNSGIGTSDTRLTNMALEVYNRALDVIQEPEVAEFNVLTLPGVTDTKLTNRVLNICETRGDSLGIIDLKYGYIPAHEQNITTQGGRVGNLVSAIAELDTRNFNSSYGCSYYPWVAVRDPQTSAILKVPPSVVALGTMGYTQTVNDVWFAPAGFTRGGLSSGVSGLNVVSADLKLTQKDRDDLYLRSVNPIASFPSEGVVIFGQKTLTPGSTSALSRINVRRLLIFLKKGISRIASTVLFEQNVKATWDSFKIRAESLLNNVQARFGLTDYRVVLDETTTTPDLIDRNILYAKVYVKPARTIEFIALDFIITNTGASFED